MTVAVIGAGMAGAAAANTLQLAGWPVEVFDKGRSVGGRMSSKRSAGGYLDMGAQYFTARSELFTQQVSQWLSAGLLSQWPAVCYRFDRAKLSESADQTARYIGSPAMQAPVKALLASIPTHLNCQITRIHYIDPVDATEANGWYLYDEHNTSFGPYQALVLTLPPVQLQSLLATACQPEAPAQATLSSVIAQLQPQVLLPCWAVNLQLAQPLQTLADAVFVKEGNISWLARQNSKPGRASQDENWLVHFSPQCSALHLSAAPAQLIALAKAELELIFDQPLQVSNGLTHRWLYAQINPAVSQPTLHYDRTTKLAIAGDWLLGGRVENAYLSGVAAAKEILANG
ncbi:hypothetical protein WG68_09370 [Arsukibacterium ikkense]|uniref:Amine oxidase domain-containing protein n=1 Tax=Arsukibacterium ikkense TaxID=336831 RepID=A0A0M2V4L4_9GAMM|nr:FAD-dependent oxidoreductase [Arsukibacterium ikkense]KKO45586.1 hypothetical protein WG68_09370 [Arsukibacterium ikkense]